MEGRYPPGVLATFSDCTDTAKEAEFNKWYEKTLIPGIEDLGFVRNTIRFENVLSNSPTFQGRPKYLTMYEVYRDDLKQALKEIRQREAELKNQGKGFDAIVKMVDALYGKTGREFRTERTGRPVTGAYIVLCYPTDPAREEEFNNWYNDKHIGEALKLGVQDTVYRYKVVDPLEVIPYRPYYLSYYETSIDPLERRNRVLSHRSKWFSDQIWVNLLGVHMTGGFRRISPPLKR